MAILEIDKYLGRSKQMIYRLGIELEGGWNKLPDGIMGLQHDGSVHITPKANPELQKKLENLVSKINRANSQREQELYAREYQRLQKDAMPPLQVGELASDILEPSKYVIWMKHCYPHVVNETCGMHVHMSFQSALNYARLMIPEYPKTVVAYLTEWAKEENLPKDHPIWPRLKNQSKFCQHRFEPDLQAAKTRKEYDQNATGNRYSAINYCFNTHGTMECRLLPMMETAEQGIRAVQRVIDIANASLVVSAKKYREDKLIGEVVVDGELGVVKHNRNEYV